MAIDVNAERRYVISGIIVVVAIIYLIRLLYLQVFDQTYAQLASSNVLREVTVYPARGLIYDREGQLIVMNEAIYDIMIVPSQVGALDTALFCELLSIDKASLISAYRKAKKYSRYKPSVFLKQVSSQDFARFQEHLHEFPGFFEQVRTIRKYPYSSAPHLLGYIGEVTQKQIDGSDGYYRPGDYYGVSGVENSYEQHLRGVNGTQYLMVDVHNREMGSYLDGAKDVAAIKGSDLKTTIDITLQNYAEQLMKGKRGSVVAIEPSTGEVLAIVSSPAYDPNMLTTGRKRGENFYKLKNDSTKPLYNRALMANYPPGSPFKPLMALIALEEGIITPSYTYTCNGAYTLPGLRVGCLSSGKFDLHRAIQKSCNTYFINLYRKLVTRKRYGSVDGSFNNWRDHLASFGLGSPLGIDMANEGDGLLPSVELYDRMYGDGQWKSSTTLSLAIGQGELGITPLQMANYMATIANKGHYYTPHTIKEITTDTGTFKPNQFTKKNTATIDAKHFPVIHNAMEDVVLKGTAKIARLDSISVCGKTGTAENPHGKDHSFFAAFAPKEEPQIAIMVVVETSGYGSTYAAPIASLVMEKYLTDSISKRRLYLEERMLNSIIEPE
jgi:penicillin-binding protein 2